jgi:hypothetical protein
MSEMEERLRAALAARAHQVQPESLRQDPPEPAARPWWRAPGSYGLLAAVAVLVLVIPVATLVLLRGGDDAPVASGPSESEQSETTTTTADGREWTEIESRVADFDGDGQDDVAQLLADDPTTETGEARVRVALASGGEPVWGVPVGKRPVGLADAADVDLDGVPEVLVQVGTDPRYVVVLAVSEESDLLAVLHNGDKIARGVGAKGFQHHWWLAQDGLWSWVSSKGDKEDEETFLVELTHWLPENGLTEAPTETCLIHIDAPEDPEDCRPQAG